jgi:hypothetical protein
MANCPYCGRWFRNKQAVRAHLKYCPLKKAGAPTRMEKLFLQFLKVIPKMEVRDRGIPKKEIIKWLKISEETLEELRQWIIKNGYAPVLELIIAGKQASP